MRPTLPGSLLALALAGPLAAEGPGLQRVLDLDLQGCANPAGLQAITSLSLRRPLAGADPLAPDAYLQGGATLASTPAYGWGGLFVEVQPAPFLTFRAQGDTLRYYGTNGALLSFASPRDPFGGPDLDRRKGQEERGSARRALAQPTLSVQVGRLVLRHQATLSWYRFSGRGPWFYEYENDLLLRASDRVQDHQTNALWAFHPGRGSLYAGLAWQTTRDRESGLYRRRAGLAAAWDAGIVLGRWGRPRATFAAGPVLEDRNRKGQWYLAATLGTSWVR